MALYSSPYARVFTNEALSSPFLIMNGTRQGCPFSPIIFILAMEPPAQSMHPEPQITGIQFGPYEHKIWFFTDHVILALSNPSTSLFHIQFKIQSFGQALYYKINEAKSNLMGFNILPLLQQL